ncbi:MAG: hypothetical protein MPN21_15490 [Thermoanaerobaculia bacterium]|nr:hypothetical protein [Thermoanaerobaculia bacterium]
MIPNEEQALLDRIESDSQKVIGECTLETKKIVAEATEYYLAMDVSDEFRQALEGYVAELRSDAEDVESQRHAQRVLAALERKKGLFFLADKWGQALNRWVAAHRDSIPMVSSLDDLYRIAPKSKPTKKWSTGVQIVFEQYGEDSVLAFLREAIALLTETAAIASAGLSYDNEDKLKGMVLVLTTNRHEEDSGLLGELATVAYKKIPGQGPLSTAVGNLCLNALCDLRGQQGLVRLSELANQLEYPANAVGLAKRKLEEAAKARGVTVQQLASMTVPEYGLED